MRKRTRFAFAEMPAKGGFYFQNVRGVKTITFKRSSHSVYDIGFHIVFRAKHRRKALYDNIAERCIKVIRGYVLSTMWV